MGALAHAKVPPP